MMEELIQKLNKPKYTYNVETIRNVKRYYLGLYRMMLVELYDANYIADPTWLNPAEIKKLFEEYGLPIIGPLNIDNIRFVKDWCVSNGDDTDVTTFLSLLIQAMYYREIAYNIDVMYDGIGAKLGERKRIPLKITRINGKFGTEHTWLLDEGSLRVLMGFCYNYNLQPFDNIIYDLALEELGVEGEFVKGFTKQQTIDNLKGILNGKYTLDGKDGPILTEWIKKQMQEEDCFGLDRVGLYNWIYINKQPEILAAQEKMIEKFGDKIVAISEHGFYTKENAELVIPIGQYALVSQGLYHLPEETDIAVLSRIYSPAALSGDFEEKALPDLNAFLGYTGQVYPQAYLDENEIEYVGCPIFLFNEEYKLQAYIDYENTEFRSVNSTIFTDLHAKLEFDPLSITSWTPQYHYTEMEKRLINLYFKRDTGMMYTTVKKATMNTDFFEKVALKVLADLEERVNSAT